MHSLKNRRSSAWKVAWPSGKVSNGATPLGVGSLRLDRTGKGLAGRSLMCRCHVV